MIVLDSDVLIDLVRKREATVGFLERAYEEGQVLATTSVNVGEVLRGARGERERLATTVEVLDGLLEVPFDDRASQRFGRLMHQLDTMGDPLPVVDGMIAAATLEQGARLSTRNVRDFGRVPELEVLDPESDEP